MLATLSRRLHASGRPVTIDSNGTADKQLGKIQRTELAEAMGSYALSGAEDMQAQTNPELPRSPDS